MGLMKDKVCVISGGAGSIGLASAKRFLAEGARVMLVDLDASRLEAVVKECNSPQSFCCGHRDVGTQQSDTAE